MSLKVSSGAWPVNAGAMPLIELRGGCRYCFNDCEELVADTDGEVLRTQHPDGSAESGWGRILEV
jgi:hypothetical protein